ncbi:MAG: mevalonate kinase, partial [Phototrophicales bacterium]
TPVYFIKGQPIQHITIGQPMRLLVATLPHATPTYITVGDVAKLYSNNPTRIGGIFKTIGQLVEWARQALLEGDMVVLGQLMQANQYHLQTLTVSDQMLDTLCDAALDAGALGAKLSGGGRGGNMIALVTPERETYVQEALLANGAQRVIPTTLQ